MSPSRLRPSDRDATRLLTYLQWQGRTNATIMRQL
jgi:hypothetical protein